MGYLLRLAPWALLGVLVAPLGADTPANPPPAPPGPLVPNEPAVPPVPEVPPAPEVAPALPVLPDELQVGRVTGEGVNLRVGPRVDNEPIVQLARGTVVIVVEKLPGWYGVRVPMGFPVAVSGEFVEKLGADEVRVKAKRLNVRVQPPEDGRPVPGAFRDGFRADQVLSFIREERGWFWVLAPEELLAYLSADYVEIMGTLSEHADAIVKARDARARQLDDLKRVRAAAAAANDSLALRTAIGEAQQRLHRLRLEGGNDKTPVALVHESLTKAVACAPFAPPLDAELAKLMLEDLDREMDLRESRAEAEIAKARGQTAPPVPSIAPEEAVVEIEGNLTWEAVPGLPGDGAYVLWQDERRKRVMRLGTGGPLPHPDLKARCDGRVWRFRGSAPGERSLGLPVVDVKEVLAPTSITR